MRHRIPVCISQLEDIVPLKAEELLLAQSQVWIPIRKFDTTVIGSTVAVSRSCLDDSEPQLRLSPWMPAKLLLIDSDGDYKLVFPDSSHAWIFKDRISSLRQLTVLQTAIDKYTLLESDFKEWRSQVV